MKTWIFQGNPDRFDIDGYLASWPPDLSWLVTRQANEIQPGDHVFLWRNKGQKRGSAAIVAAALVIDKPALRPDEASAVPFWKQNDDRGRHEQVRVRLALQRVANGREELKASWLQDDPILSNLPNLRMQTGTNYLIPDAMAERLHAMWSRVGIDWTWMESLAGLWAYMRTIHGPVSKLPGSPVAQVALLTGRGVGGTYNKVMNFRSLDPRDERAGLSGASDTDRKVFAAFFDQASQSLNVQKLEQEFERLWGSSNANAVGADEREITERTAKSLETFDLQALMRAYAVRRGTVVVVPEALSVRERYFVRDPYVIAIARLRAGHRCEVAGCAAPTFQMDDGKPYVEVHHILPLSEGGPDSPENVAAVCPTHHREAHLGQHRTQLNAALTRKRSEEEGSALRLGPEGGMDAA